MVKGPALRLLGAVFHGDADPSCLRAGLLGHAVATNRVGALESEGPQVGGDRSGPLGGEGHRARCPCSTWHKRAAEVGAVTGLECLLEARHAALDCSDKRGAGTLGSGDRDEVGANASKEKPQE